MKPRHYLILLVILQVFQIFVTIGTSELDSPKDVACNLVQWIPFVNDCE